MTTPVAIPKAGLRPAWDRRRVQLAAVGAICLLAVAASMQLVGVSPLALIRGWSDIANLLDRMLPPRLLDLGTTATLVLETFFMAFLGTLLALVLSVPLAFLAARNTTPHKLLYGPARGLITACRAIPDLVFALIFVRALGLGILPGVLALGLHSVGMVGKLLADAIEEIDEGPRDAITSVGAGRLQTVTTSVLPQITPALVGTALYRLDINVRTSTILGFVGAGGIGQELRSTLGNLRYQEAFGTVLVIFALIVAVEAVSVAVRRSLLHGEDKIRRDASVFTFLFGRGRRAAAMGDVPRPPALTQGPAISLPWDSERRLRFGFGGLGLLVLVLSVWVTKFNPVELVTSLGDVARVTARFVPPDFASHGPALARAMVETVAIGMTATAIGVVLSIPLAFLASANVAPARWVYLAARYLVVAIRGVPEFVLAVIFVAALGLGPFAGALALGIGTVGFMSKLLADAIEEVAQGPRDALDSVGATRLQQTVTAVVPQMTPALVSNGLYMLDINVRSSVVLGIVGAGGVGFLLVQSVRTLAFEVTGAILLSTFLVVFAIERLSGWIRRRII